jgi:hypothetical protein
MIIVGIVFLLVCHMYVGLTIKKCLVLFIVSCIYHVLFWKYDVAVTLITLCLLVGNNETIV